MVVSIYTYFLSHIKKRLLFLFKLIKIFRLQIRLAKEILLYRIALRDAAAYNARVFGYEGWGY
jgi:hypothetical protein